MVARAAVAAALPAFPAGLSTDTLASVRCPYCTEDDDKVVDSRPADDGGAVRRRRECLSCGRRFTTYERLEELPLMVVKRSGRRILHATLYGTPTTTDPAFGLGVSEAVVHRLLYSGLTRYRTRDLDWGWELEAARRIQQLDPTHVAFELRPGLTFSGGYGEITADDVRFSLERVVDPAMGSPERATWGPLAGVDVTGRYSGVIVLDEPFPALHMVALPGGSGSILSREAVSPMPGARLRWEVPAASGPYLLGEWREGQQLVLVRNPEWPADRPPFDEIHILQIFAPSVLELGFEAGDLDFTNVSESSCRALRERPIPGSTLEVRPSLYYALGANLSQ